MLTGWCLLTLMSLKSYLQWTSVKTEVRHASPLNPLALNPAELSHTFFFLFCFKSKKKTCGETYRTYSGTMHNCKTRSWTVSIWDFKANYINKTNTVLENLWEKGQSTARDETVSLILCCIFYSYLDFKSKIQPKTKKRWAAHHLTVRLLILLQEVALKLWISPKMFCVLIQQIKESHC